MPGVSSDSGGGALVPLSPESLGVPLYPLHHGLKFPISRLSILWARGNSLRVSVFAAPSADDSVNEDAGGKVVEVKVGGGDGEISDAHWRRIAYGSWEYIMEYSKDINALLGNKKLPSGPVIDDSNSVITKGEELTSLKAAWELLEMFYAEKQSQSWLPERVVGWLADYDDLFSGTHPTVHSKLVDFQKELVNLQVVEDYPKYWEVMSLALAVGWLDIVVKMLRLHGSYQLDQLSNHETENALVEAVAVLISKMPRMRLELEAGKLGECFKAKPDFVKAWEKWRAQINKLDSSAFWFQCAHQQTREGLRKSMYSLAQKCIQLKPMASAHRLMGLIIGILGENTEVVLAECLKGFGPWMVAHAIELLIAGSDRYEMLLHEERQNLGGISLEELHRLVYAQVLSSHPLTWQIAPIYLTSCMKQGRVLLQVLLSKQPVQHNQLLLKNLEICCLYELDSITSNIMKQWEGLIQLLGSESKTAGGLEFLHKCYSASCGISYIGTYSDYHLLFNWLNLLLMKNPSTPQRFWLPLLYDSELSMARLRPNFIEAELPPQALNSVRLVLATNLGRAILEE
ncbi:hypothetical protein CRYUN_Cryun03dG0037500 [Craigia yunnanensis]